MLCPVCSFENPDDSKFCGSCGATLEAGGASQPPPEAPAPAPEPAPVPKPARKREPEEFPAFEPPKPRESTGDDSDDPFKSLTKIRKAPAPAPDQTGEGAQAQASAPAKGPSLCSNCHGAFPPNQLKKIDRELLCELCETAKLKAQKKPPMSMDSFTSGGAPPPPSARAPGKETKRIQAAPKPVSGVMIAVIAGAVVVVLTLLGLGLVMALSA